jgi:hypothetical protein
LRISGLISPFTVDGACRAAKLGDKLAELMPLLRRRLRLQKTAATSLEGNGDLQILGGPRCRLLVTLKEEVQRGWMFITAVNQVDRFIEYLSQKAMPWRARVWPREVPARVKTPVNFVRPGFRFCNSHMTTNQRVSSELVSLLHYKFCRDLQARLTMAANEGNDLRRGQALREWVTLSYLSGWRAGRAGSASSHLRKKFT